MARVSRKRNNKASETETKAAEHGRVYQVALYVRLSVEDMRKKISDSIGTQKALLLSFIKTQPGMALYDIYEDVNRTGTNFNRPALIRMMGDIQAGLVNCVIVKDVYVKQRINRIQRW